MSQKTCSKCKTTKVRETDFYTGGTSRDGYQSQCKDCHRDYVRTKRRTQSKLRQCLVCSKPQQPKWKYCPQCGGAVT